MADYSDLIEKAQKTVRQAHNYLNDRQSIAPESETNRIGEWRKTLNHWEIELQQAAEGSTEAFAAGQQKPLNLLSEHLDLTSKQIEGLHENDDFASVELVLHSLDNQLSLFVGTHGSGGEKPPTGGIIRGKGRA